MNLINRPRRLRTSPTLRSMMRETRMSPSSLIYPIFAIEGENIKNPIASLPGQFQWSPDRICEAIEECIQAGVEKVMLFGLPAHKDEIGSGRKRHCTAGNPRHQGEVSGFLCDYRRVHV